LCTHKFAVMLRRTSLVYLEVFCLSSACFKCGEDGHMSRECPNADASGGRGGGGGGKGEEVALISPIPC